jgi:glycosyltransferase involved in cell wall biosynthesis
MLTARMVDRVIACSEACREDYMRWGQIPPRKIVTVYNGVDLARVRRPPEAELRAVRASLQVEGRPLVGIVGRLSAEKDHQTFLEAMRLVHRAVPSVAAIVIGKGPDELALIKATERLGLGRVVTFLGAPPEIMALLASLDVLVLSSRTEGLPTVLLEGQALGVPVVTTDGGGARETVREGETGFIVPCGDSQQLAARMIQLLQDEPLRCSLGEKGRAHVFSRFSADRMAADILRLCHV